MKLKKQNSALKSTKLITMVGFFVAGFFSYPFLVQLEQQKVVSPNIVSVAAME